MTADLLTLAAAISPFDEATPQLRSAGNPPRRETTRIVAWGPVLTGSHIMPAAAFGRTLGLLCNHCTETGTLRKIDTRPNHGTRIDAVILRMRLRTSDSFRRKNRSGDGGRQQTPWRTPSNRRFRCRAALRRISCGGSVSSDLPPTGTLQNHRLGLTTKPIHGFYPAIATGIRKSAAAANRTF